MVKGQYFRPRGYSPRYSKFQTALYVSRKARMGRGLQLSPSRTEPSGPNEKTFWFSSPRGPASTGGFWKVHAVRADSGDGSGIGAGLKPARATAPSGLFCPGEGTDVKVVLACWEQVTSNNPYVVTGYGGRSTEPYSGNTYSDSYWIYTPNWTGRERLREVYTSGWSFIWAEWVLTVNSWTIGPDAIAPNPYDHGGYYPDQHKFQVVEVYDNATGDLLHQNDAGFESPWCSYDSAAPPPSSGPPAGYVRGSDLGQWAYSCDCPDFAATEGPYYLPLAPSHRRSRAWTRPRPEFPCKHIVAAALGNADLSAVMAWTAESMPDLPARELWAQAAENWANWERTTPTRWEVEEAYRSGQRSIRAAQGRQRQAEYEDRVSWETRKNLGEVWDLNESGDFKGRFGEDRETDWDKFYRNRQSTYNEATVLLKEATLGNAKVNPPQPPDMEY